MPRSAGDIRHFIIAGALIAIGTGVMYWLLDTVLALPVEASRQASVVDGVVNLHLILIAFLFSLVVVFMLYSVVAFRRRPGDDGDGEHFEGHSLLEVVWTVVPLIVVVIFGYIGIVTLNDITQAAPNEVKVNVTGFQWSWSFEYPEDGFLSTELVLPVDRQARMLMNSRDVIHSFWIPEMRMKQDLVPGKETTLVFTPTLIGEYKLRCAELCGLSHYSMLATVRIVSQEDYDAWLADQSASVTPEEPDTALVKAAPAVQNGASTSNN
ncbi:MAG: cytochrome c oxidase subunit II [Caldilineaceae bacterium]